MVQLTFQWKASWSIHENRSPFSQQQQQQQQQQQTQQTSKTRCALRYGTQEQHSYENIHHLLTKTSRKIMVQIMCGCSMQCEFFLEGHNTQSPSQAYKKRTVYSYLQNLQQVQWFKLIRGSTGSAMTCSTAGLTSSKIRMCFNRNIPWKFNSSPLKIYTIPKGKDRLPTIIFQGRAVKLRGCSSKLLPILKCPRENGMKQVGFAVFWGSLG